MKLEKLAVAFFEAGKIAAASDQPEVLHPFRVAAKRLRYTIEIIDPPGSDHWLNLLRLIQQQLGDMNDAFVAERYLRSRPTLSTRARPLPALLHANAQSHIVKFQNAWQRRFGPRTEKAWLAWARSITSG